jgi:arginyl-tRNA synthetase
VVDEVGRDPIRFMMLYRKNDAPLDFDFAKVTEQSKDNPVFYVQYASARCHSVFRQASSSSARRNSAERPGARLDLLTDEGEMALIRKLAEYPRVIESAAPRRWSRTGWLFTSTIWPVPSTRTVEPGHGKPDLRFVKVNDPELTMPD